MSDVVGRLLLVREFCETMAASDLRLCQARLEAATADHEDVLRMLQSYRQERARREHELYQNILNRPVTVRKIEEVKLAVLQMQNEEKSLADRVVRAAEVKDAASAAQAKARESWRVRLRDRQKIEFVAELNAESAKREAEREEELRVEEIPAQTATYAKKEDDDERYTPDEA